MTLVLGSTPGWIQGYVPSTLEWSNEFKSKADVFDAGTSISSFPQFINWNNSGFPGWHQTSRLVFDQPVTTSTDFALWQVQRTTSFVGGSPSNINSVIRLGGNYGAGDATNEWGLSSILNTSGNSGGEIVAGFFQASRNVSSTDFITSLIADSIDKTSLGTNASGVSNLAGVEIDLECNSADDGGNSGTFGGIGVRKGIHMVAVRWNVAVTTQTEISDGIWFTTQTGGTLSGTDAFTNYQSVIGFGINTQIRNALDTRGAITPAGSSNPVSAVTMTAGHIIDFKGGVAKNSVPGNYLWYDTGTSKLKYNVGGTTVMSVDNSGNARFLGTSTPSVTP